MALNGQASGGWTESSSALRILYAGVRNSVGELTPDAFTQTNPPHVTTAGTISTNVDTSKFGVLSGSVAFSRPDVGENYIGGNAESLSDPLHETLVRPVGLFINSANGNSYENLPGVASNKGPYVCGQGTLGSRLFETEFLADPDAGGAFAAGDTMTYIAGMELVASRNGYLCPRTHQNAAGAAIINVDLATITAEVEHGNSASTTLGLLKMAPDSTQAELVFDLKV